MILFHLRLISKVSCSVVAFRRMALNRYLTSLDRTRAKFDASASEVADIESAVVQVCYRILEEVYELDNRFKTSRVLKTGSFYEGTKISEPNEFD